MSDSTQKNSRESHGLRSASLLIFGVVCASVSGYFIGVRSPMNPPREEHSLEAQETSVEKRTVVPATSYSEIPTIRAEQKQKQVTALSSIKQLETAPNVPEPTASVAAKVDPRQKLVSLEKRETLRAFDGAPPIVPHNVTQMSTATCMSCHEHGIRTKTLRAAKMSHPYYANCTQCHVQSKSNLPSTMEVENSFAGLESVAGSRSFSTAPPAVPHPIWMRNDCLGCHGRTAAAGLETTHPWRTNCLQCHTPTNAQETGPPASETPFLPPPKLEVKDES